MTWRDWAGRLEVLDSRGKRIDQVRAVCEDEGGVRVRILGTVEGGRPAVTGWDPVTQTVYVVEFECFVRGGRVVYKPPDERGAPP